MDEGSEHESVHQETHRERKTSIVRHLVVIWLRHPTFLLQSINVFNISKQLLVWLNVQSVSRRKIQMSHFIELNLCCFFFDSFVLCL